MSVALWWETTSIIADTAVALGILVLSIALIRVGFTTARQANVFSAAIVTATLAVIVAWPRPTPTARDLQDTLNQQLSIPPAPFATQIGADAWSNIHTITVCTVLMHYIYTALGLLLVVSAVLTGFAAVRRFGNHPAAQRLGIARRARTFLINRHMPEEAPPAEPAAAQPRPAWSTVKKPGPRVALGVAAAIIATGALIVSAVPTGLRNSEPKSAKAQNSFVEAPAPALGSDTSGGSLQASSRPASEPDIFIRLPLAHEPCSINEARCVANTADGRRFTFDLAHTRTVTGVSLIPDELIPGRIVTAARWDFDDANQTSETVRYDPDKDRGWAIRHPLSLQIRTSAIALTVLSSVPIDPNAYPPPGPGIAAVLSITARPPLPCDPDYTGALPTGLACPTARVPR